MTSGSAGVAVASATTSGATTTSSFTVVMCAIIWFSSVRNFSFSLCGRSFTRTSTPNTRWLMSTSRFFGMSDGRHSISISRNNCSRMPPSVFTPSASPLSTTGTVTVSLLSMAMRCKSTWSRVPLIGSNCQSTIMAFTRSLSSARSKIVLCPLSDLRIRRTCRGSTATEAASLPAPYSTAGIFPPTRTRRAAFLVPGSRFCASRMLMSVAVAIIPFPSFVGSSLVVRKPSSVLGE